MKLATKEDKKYIIIIPCLIFILNITLLTSCNKQVFDTTWNFDYAYVKLPDGSVVKGELESWKDWDDSDVVQVKINGVTYLTHYSNVVMVDR